MEYEHTNALINESSPYLLQHAHNPVDWNAWGEEARAVARQENKLMIVSIGYSSCHWCHVMEHESFEDTTVAAVMNNDYIPIKVDREERPDVDAIYMNAVQLMTGQGGWPLNVVTLPDGRPVWGGTYLPKQNWMDALQQIATIYKEDPEKLEEYATRLADGIKGMNVLQPASGALDFDKESIARVVDSWSASFDTVEGGMRRAPKFMMPNNYQFLLRYAHQKEDKELANYIHKTLKQMAFGGVYDQLGGGFSRYSTDKKWHIPHFEKMLYDNGQLLSLYSKAYLTQANPLYKETVYGIISFLERDMLDKSGGFYTALDADSKDENGKLEEGAFYVWKKEELMELLGADFDLFSSYFNINSYGFWEEDKYVLIRKDEDAEFVEEHNLDAASFKQAKKDWKKKLLRYREKRAAPRLDDKVLTGWNALTLNGLTDAYRSFGEEKFLDLALKNAHFIVKNQLQPDGSLYRNYKEGKSTINAYLEDYAAVIEAFINLYEATADKQWLDHAQRLSTYVLAHFANQENEMLYFTSNLNEELITRNIEYQDNVIPASNSIMAKNLFKLGHLDYNPDYIERAGRMLLTIDKEIANYPGGYSNWLDLKLNLTYPYYEIVITGMQAKERLKALCDNYIPNAVFAATDTQNSSLDLFEGRWDDASTWIYVCTNQSCKLPVGNVNEALSLLGD